MTVLDQRPVQLDDPDTNRTVERTLCLLDGLAGRQSIRLSDLARQTGFAKSTVYRLLRALVARDYAAREGRGYVLGRRVFELAHESETASADELGGRLMPYLVDLYERTRGAVGIGVLNRDHVIHSTMVHNHRHAGVVYRGGERVPAHRGAVGKLLIAYEPDAPGRSAHVHLHSELALIRRRGIAYAYGERIANCVEVAAPVFGPAGTVIAGISVVGPAGVFDPVAAGAGVLRCAHGASVFVRQQLSRAA